MATMSEISQRYRRVASGFTQRAEQVPAAAWDNPTPCEGWIARDVVRHMVEWMPALCLSSVGISIPNMPSVDDDPLGAWLALDGAFQSALDDPEVAAREFDMQMGRSRVDDAIGTFCLGDILVHTWDLARAAGLDDTLDATEVHSMYEGIQSMDQVLRESGHYGPRVDVSADADEQTKLIAFTGRRP